MNEIVTEKKTITTLEIAEMLKMKHYKVLEKLDGTKDRKIKVSCGCFLGTIDEFLEKVEQTHGDSKHAIVYRTAADIALAQIGISDEDDA